MTFGQWVKYLLLVIFIPNSRLRKEWQMLRLLNKDRKDFALPKLLMQDDLRKVSRQHSKDMADKEYFEHVNIKGQNPADRLKVARVTDVVSGENLAKIGGYEDAVREAEEGLMRSPGHRANILNKQYNCVGIGIFKSKEGIFYFTQSFAKRILKFTKKVRKRVSIKKGLKLKGVFLEPIFGVYYKVKYSGTDRTVSKGTYKLEENHFDFTVNFPETGVFDVDLFVIPSEKAVEMRLTNRFEVRVKSWWFWH